MYAAKMKLNLERSVNLQTGFILIWGINEGDILMIEFPAFNWGNRAFKFLTSTKNDMQ